MALSGIYPLLTSVRFEQNDLSAIFRLGSSCPDNQGGQWTYCSFAAGGSIYDAYWIDENYAAVTLLNATTPASQRPVGVGLGQVAMAASSYGWLWCGGQSCGGVGFGIKANVLISCVKDVPLYATGTAGKLDDGSTLHYQILGLCTTANEPGSGTAAIEVFASMPLSLTGL